MSAFSNIKIYLAAFFIAISASFMMACEDARNRHDKGMIQHPQSDPYGPKDSTMIQEDSLKDTTNLKQSVEVN